MGSRVFYGLECQYQHQPARVSGSINHAVISGSINQQLAHAPHLQALHFHIRRPYASPHPRALHCYIHWPYIPTSTGPTPHICQYCCPPSLHTYKSTSLSLPGPYFYQPISTG